MNIKKYGLKENHSGSYGVFFPGRRTDMDIPPTCIEHFVGIKEITLKVDITKADVMREVDTLRLSQSPFIVKLLGSEMQGAHACRIFTEICTCSLDDILQRRNKELIFSKTGFIYAVPATFQSWEMCLQACHQILSGLQFLHEQGIIHRDIKPANVLKSVDGVFKICDFGLAKFVAAGVKNTTGRGSDWYNAPEKRRGGKYDIASDVYAAGISLSETFILFAVNDDSHQIQKYNELHSARKAFQEESFRGHVEAIPALRFAHAMMERIPSKRPTLEQALYALQNYDFSPYPSIVFPSILEESTTSTMPVDNHEEQWAERYLKSTCRVGHEMVHAESGERKKVKHNGHFSLEQNRIYFTLEDDTSGYMPMYESQEY